MKLQVCIKKKFVYENLQSDLEVGTIQVVTHCDVIVIRKYLQFTTRVVNYRK